MARPNSNKSSRKSRGTSFGKQSDAEKSFYKKKKSDRPDSSAPRRSGKSEGPSAAGRGFYKKDGGTGSSAYGRRSDEKKPFNSRGQGKDSRFSSSPRGEKKSFDNEKPARPFNSRSEGFEGKRPYNSRPDGNFRGKDQRFSRPQDGEKKSFDNEKPDRPFKSRSEGFEGKKPFNARPGGNFRGKDQRFSRSQDGEKKSFGDSGGKTDRPFHSRPEGKPGFHKSGPPKFTKPGRFDKKDDTYKPREKPEGFSKPKRDGEEGSEKKPFRPFERKSFIQSRVVRSGDFVKNIKKEGSDQSTLAKQEGQTRLNKYIANAGVGSRRQADELIKMGLISVNGVTITELGSKVKAGDVVRYEDRVLKAEKPVYVLLNKPKGFITTTEDPQERNTVMGLVAGACKERIYPVGRLDRNTTGLLLLTNDGDLADKLTHPSYKAKKIYKVELSMPLTKNDLKTISEGVVLEEGRAYVDDIAILSDDNRSVGLEIHIGWNRVVRRIFESLGYEVVKLDRSVFAGLDKKDLNRGQWRFLKPEEVIMLKHFH